MARISRQAYADMYGPTTGDRVRLGDTGLLIEIAPGGHTIWHRHPVPSFALILEGELEVQLENGTLKRFKAGEALAEVVDTPHYGRNVGSGAVKLVVFYAGSAGQPLSYTEAEK